MAPENTPESSDEAAVPSLDYPTSWPRAATPTNLIPLWAGEFKSHSDWVSFATKRLTGCRHPYGHEVAPICVDALGRRCSIGGDFMRARDEDAFPVRYFWECVAPSDHSSLEATAKAICRSGKFETGQGTCALLCMDHLGSARRNCSHAGRVHGDLARAVIAAATGAA